METTWSLKELYPSFDSPEFKNGCAGIGAKIQKLKDVNLTENISQSLLEFIEIQTELGIAVRRLADYCQLTLSTDADNREALKYIEYIEDKITETVAPETRFAMYLSKIDKGDLDSAINSHNILKAHRFYIEEIKENAKYLLSEAEENIISKMKNTGSSAWEKFQENVMSTLTVDMTIKGKEERLPFAAVRNLAYHKDSAIRKDAYQAELTACQKVAKPCAAALNGIKGEVISLCSLKGYESPLHMTLLDSRMDKEVLDALISAIRKNAGMFTPYFKKKAHLLGKEKLPFYDLFAPIGQSGFSFTYKEAIDFVVKQFTQFSPELGNYAKKAAESGWIDVYPKEGKRGGAFCQNLHYLKESRFLLNFTGSFNDVLTIAHELGHGYHGYCLEKESFLNSDYPMPIAETASTFCETLVINGALKQASGNEALEILENDISSSAQVIVDILSRFIFESTVFEKRKNGSVTEAELCEIMENAQKEAYADGLDHTYTHKYMWVVKPHYYSADVNFYNFPYAFGALFAKGLYGLYLKTGNEFLEKYNKLFAATGKMNLKDAAAIADIDITGNDFWQSSFQIISRDIDRFLQAADLAD